MLDLLIRGVHMRALVAIAFVPLLALSAVATTAIRNTVTSTHVTSATPGGETVNTYTYQYDDTSGNPYPSRVKVAGTWYTEDTACPPSQDNRFCWKLEDGWISIIIRPDPGEHTTVTVETTRDAGTPTPDVTEKDPAWSNT